ncbi:MULTISPECIES: Holliday junction resolvase RuvX [unclassified Roseiflexus]|mgnify:FL=1|jgi:putative Holliday junction resolvase|uniref:Putative pre-16S rRNA nuclease n=1 Tax=Roseiflexus sp. (strain RS-1) TaxID=357808 RepID=YQGF_ROSS1|nr:MULTISPECIES: Holliday junction resolvase RuvX [unclassified Roseiflexus]A5UY83.1 RecName: Full=Putative pre-16S rRNA nuclease [Roseiflexus sp. RS-1]ABQ91586.1 Holliday junction resolvase YqgF [Roseiflexus sp. RS-1]MBO9323339.1 Holliday junction resolvase RuvX [Roseiflexus sp.]MCL6540081.1 Holliday junction resolvase RuvX [Roseiflexus sp.]
MSSEPGRVMALDVGERRIGVALSDPTRMLASPLTTIRAVPRSTALKRILTLIRDYQVTALVVGLPLTMNGDIGPQATLVQQFVDELRPLIDIPIFFVDERLTTVAAERMMIDLKIKPEQRRARIDEVAASIILQDFLDSQR